MRNDRRKIRKRKRDGGVRWGKQEKKEWKERRKQGDNAHILSVLLFEL